MDEGQDLINIEDTYDSVSEEYGAAFSNEHSRKPKDREVLRRFAREIGGRKPVWDFGCGPGQTAAFLNSLGLQVSGLDLSEKILKQARTLHPDICFRKGNILNLEFEDDSLAGVVAFYAIVHFTPDQVATAFREILRVLQPGGLFLFTYHVGEEPIHLDEFLGRRVDIDFMFFPTDFILRLLEEMGFERIELIEREPYAGVEYQSRRAYVFAIKPERERKSS